MICRINIVCSKNMNFFNLSLSAGELNTLSPLLLFIKSTHMASFCSITLKTILPLLVSGSTISRFQFTNWASVDTQTNKDVSASSTLGNSTVTFREIALACKPSEIVILPYLLGFSSWYFCILSLSVRWT